MTRNPHHMLKPFQAGARQGQFYSLPELAKTYPNVNRLPVSTVIVRPQFTAISAAISEFVPPPAVMSLFR